MSFAITQSETVGGRLDLANLLNHHNMKRAVEVGTDKAVFASEFLRVWHGHMLFCVDNYAPYDEMAYDRTCDMMMAVHRLAPFAHRCQILKMNSTDAARWMAANQPEQDFVYIDGDHTYEAVNSDIKTWWKLIRVGGILAGHDWLLNEECDGVRRAVTEFAQSQQKQVWIGNDYNQPRSWWIHK